MRQTFGVGTYSIKYIGSKYETVCSIISADSRVTELSGVKIGKFENFHRGDPLKHEKLRAKSHKDFLISNLESKIQSFLQIKNALAISSIFGIPTLLSTV